MHTLLTKGNGLPVLLLLLSGMPAVVRKRFDGISGSSPIMAASAMRHGLPNNIFTDVLTLEGRPGVTVLKSELLTGNAAVLDSMDDHLDMERVCSRLGGGVPGYCKTSYPEHFSNLRELPLKSPKPGKQRQLEICNLLKGKVPSFCRLDAKDFHTCAVRRQVS